MLSLRKMFEAYKLLQDHLPSEYPEEGNVLEWVEKIVDDMVFHEVSFKFIDFILLISNKTLEEIQELNPSQLIKLFVDGILDNRVLDFRGFLSDIGYTHV